MIPVCIAAIFVLLPPEETVREHLAVRDFRAAFQLAESDSARGAVMLAAGNDSMAAELFAGAFAADPSTSLFALKWQSVVLAAESTGHSLSAELRRELSFWGDSLSWGPGDILSLVETSETLDDDLLSDSLTEILFEDFPDSEEAYEVLGWIFWDGLYPVWRDDSARVEVIDGFLSEYGDVSDFWRSRARRYRYSASLATADSTCWRTELEEWLESCPDQPQPYLSAAGMLIDRDSAYSEALELSERGLEIMESGFVPVGMPQEEWELMETSITAGLVCRHCQAMAKMGSTEEAFIELSTAMDSLRFSIEDYNTSSQLLLEMGRLQLDAGDTLSALEFLSLSVMEGDAGNRWSGSALELMEEVLLPDASPVGWTRERFDYSGPVFADVTGLLGPDSLLRGSRVSWCDWDQDGYPDLYAGSSLFRNLEGTGFLNVTEEAGLGECRGNGGIWGDLDRNGYPDLVTAGNPPQVFLNHNGTMVESSAEGAVIPDSTRVEGVALLDWNADGWLDLYLACYEKPGELGAGTDDVFCLGGPEGFSAAGDSLGMVPFLQRPLCGRGVSPCDFDRDGDVDIFVSNYRLQENFLWENVDGMAQGNALRRGIAGTDSDGWWGHTIGSAWSDFDCDGDWDLFSANLAHPRYITFSDRSMLYLNEGGSFRDVRAASGIKFEETHSNPVWGDFDCNGYQDLFITSVYPDRRSFLYLNDGSGHFRDVTWISGTRIFDGWGAATADFNLDGRLDLAVGTGEGPVLLMNVTGQVDWVLVRLLPPGDCNPSALGCTVVLSQDSLTMMRQVSGGSGTTSQDGGPLHFGLPRDSSFVLELLIPGSDRPVASTQGKAGALIVIGP